MKKSKPKLGYAITTRRGIRLLVPIATFLAIFIPWIIANHSKIDTYDKCLNQKDSQMLSTYPYLCIDSTGKSFVDPGYLLDSKTIPPIDQWETYQDDTLKLEFKYPEKLGITPLLHQSDDGERIGIDISSRQKNLHFSITVGASKNPLTHWGTRITTLEQKTNYPNNPFKLNNIKGIEIVFPSAEILHSNHKSIHFYNNGYLVSIDRISRGNDIVSQTISDQIINSLTSLSNEE